MPRWIKKLFEWYVLEVKKIREDVERDFEYRLSRQEEEMKKLIEKIDTIRIVINDDHFPLLVSKDSLLSQKEQMDIAKIVNSNEYQSLRSFYLKTTVHLFEQAGQRDAVASNVIMQFANLLKEFVVDMDRMKIEHPEEQSPQEYGE